MTTIQATGAESLEGGREAKEKKNIFSGCLECCKFCLFVFGSFVCLFVCFFFPYVTEKAAWQTRETNGSYMAHFNKVLIKAKLQLHL